MEDTSRLSLKARTDSLFKHVPVGDEKALKQAFYSTAASLFVLLVCGAGYAVYLILESFLKPLLWAVLVGTFLHPFKLSCTSIIRSWLNGLQRDNTPFIVGIFLLPLSMLNSFSEAMYSVLVIKWKIILGTISCITCVYMISYFELLGAIFKVFQYFFLLLYDTLGIFSSGWMYTLVVGYLLLVIFYKTSGNNFVIKLLGIPVWACFILNLVSAAGPYKVLVFAVVVVLVITGIYAQLSDSSSSSEKDEKAFYFFGRKVTFMKEDSEEAEDAVQCAEEREIQQDTDTKEYKPIPLTPKRSLSRVTGKKQKLSDFCFVALLWYVVAVRLWSYTWMLQLLMLPFVFVLLKKTFLFLNSKRSYVLDRMSPKFTVAAEWFNEKRQVLVPGFVHGLVKIMVNGDKKILKMLDAGIDKLMSTALILMMIIGSIIFTVLLAVQVQQESMHIVGVVSRVVNDTVQNNPGFNTWLPESKEMEKTMESIVDNAQVYGKDWISSVLDNYFQGKDEDREKLEQQLFQLWDKLAKSLSMKSSDTLREQERSNFSLEALRAHASFEVMPWEDIVSLIKDNVDTLQSVLQSVYTVIIGNVNIAFSIIAAIIRVLLGGGTAVLNFVISSVIFLTALSILLTSSKKQYLPMEWIQKLTPSGTQNDENESQLAAAVEEAISGVFMASLKMAAFYGLYTWHTYLLFECKTVFIPAALAAVFAVVPVLGAYWSFVPGALELYLSGRQLHALFLAIFQFIPTLVVDAALYSDIKGGGHPYLTGLAIAGGMFWLGLEGAIVGPIMLCCLIVAVNVYTVMLGSSDQQEDSTGAQTPSVQQTPGKIRE